MPDLNADCIVIGAGPAGLSAAFRIAEGGYKVVVFERGRAPGDKNVMGGVLYAEDVKDVFPVEKGYAPLERRVVEETYAFLDDKKSVSVSTYPTPDEAYTVFRSRIDKWMADVVNGKGAEIIAGTCVNGLLRKGGAVWEVLTDRGTAQAPVVIGADGAISFSARWAGLRRRSDVSSKILSVKEVIYLGRERINERFGLQDEEGVIIDVIGIPHLDVVGGGFIYTCREHVCIGAGSRIEFLKEKGLSAVDLLVALKKHPFFQRFISGGNTEEYLAHMIPLGGIRKLEESVSDGFILCGDAMGTTSPDLTGFPFAVRTGASAGLVAVQALKKGDFSRGFLISRYRKLLEENGCLHKVKQAYRVNRKIISKPSSFARLPEEIMSMVDSAEDIISLSAGEVFERAAKGFLRRLLKKVRSLTGTDE